MKQKKFNSIDLFKLFMAVAVVAIHTNPIINWTNQAAIRVIVIIEEWAVPFFFIASGFFLFCTMKRPYKDSLARIDNYIIKIVKMYCAWTVISLPVIIYGYVISGNGVISCILSFFKYFLFVGKLYNAYHLWYLLSLIYALVAIRFMIKKDLQLHLIVSISVSVSLFGEVMSVLMGHLDTIEGMLHKIVSLYQYVFNGGGIFTGIVYVSAGMLIACLQLRINKWVGIVMIAALNLLKVFLSGIIIRLIMPIEAAILFMVLLDVQIRENEIWEKCRKMSTVIYLSHLLFFSKYTFLIIRKPNKLGFDSFIVTLLLSVANAIFLIAMQKRGRFRLLKHII